MAGYSPWVESNWFNLIQMIGIIGSLWMAIDASRREARAKEIENLLSVSDHHREMWNEAHQREDLKRILRADADALAKPASVTEEEFLNIVITHFQIGWHVGRAGGITTLSELAADARGFFSLPLPRAVWEKTKQNRNQRFVRFVERAMKEK
jgi:hypothetical protein